MGVVLPFRFTADIESVTGPSYVTGLRAGGMTLNLSDHSGITLRRHC